jgi:AraC-like DNA-binding protein
MQRPYFISESPAVPDPLSDVVAMLQPAARVFKVVSAAGRWRIRRSELGDPFYCVVLEGACRFSADGCEPMVLHAGDFVLIPAAQVFTTSSVTPPTPSSRIDTPQPAGDGHFRIGDPDVPHDVRMLVGHCAFASPDAELLVSLLPRVVHIRGDRRLATLVQLVGEESRGDRPAREVVLARLLEVLFIEALRSSGTETPPGLARALADPRLAVAIRRMHDDPTQSWTVAELASEAALSRSVFFERFSRAVGLAPMEYLLSWRMALARKMLRMDTVSVAEVAERVGYRSASTFSVAFTRHVGIPPMRYARGEEAGGDAGDGATRSAVA